LLSETCRLFSFQSIDHEHVIKINVIPVTYIAYYMWYLRCYYYKVYRKIKM